MFTPRYSITDKMAQHLMDIQRASVIVDYLPLPPSVLKKLQKQSRESTVLLSTKIEGNRLDERAKRQALYAQSEEGLEQEVFNLMKAIEFLEQAEHRQLPITEELIKQLHAVIQVVHGGRRPKFSEYRQAQNVVGNRNQSGYYMPPEYQDVPTLMEDLVAWVNSPNSMQIPAPIKAGIFMYQFLTIHPYMDGNGRTARMFATYLLRKAGLGLKGLFVLETFYDRNLTGYYESLQMDLHHNYYFGRNDADLTRWLEFFIEGAATVFSEVADEVRQLSYEYISVEPELIRGLDPQQRMVFAQLAFKRVSLSTTDIRRLLDLSERTIRDKVKKWIAEGFLVPRDEDAQRIRSVTLAEKYRKLAEEMEQDLDRYRYLLQ
ncbi:Fic family protein [Tumebacillus flagellatus]|uniref:Cell filamentation protein Fic n=1 Tax=Tumebacillus flagellatus TaxID=1157490 RepID=A0A074LNL6_9BACL|nr:Fic family protein [Tumebacillus flagellatus]KEO81443.1 cell filamentation protein Fic [Tumebacillus flagellatus]